MHAKIKELSYENGVDLSIEFKVPLQYNEEMELRNKKTL